MLKYNTTEIPSTSEILYQGPDTRGIQVFDVVETIRRKIYNGDTLISNDLIWELVKNYFVQFNGNGSTSGSMAKQTFTLGVAQALAANAFARTYYSFLGWSTSSSATTATYTNKQSVTNLTTTAGSTVNLYAIWKDTRIFILTAGVPNATYLNINSGTKFWSTTNTADISALGRTANSNGTLLFSVGNIGTFYWLFNPGINLTSFTKMVIETGDVGINGGYINAVLSTTGTSILLDQRLNSNTTHTYDISSINQVARFGIYALGAPYGTTYSHRIKNIYFY